jgi:hypothetical protein
MSKQTQLEQGTLTHVQKTYQAADGKKKTWIIEYDPETREFISSDPEKVRVPAKINGEQLSDLQKEHYRNGSVVELSDGTRLQRRGKQPQWRHFKQDGTHVFTDPRWWYFPPIDARTSESFWQQDGAKGPLYRRISAGTTGHATGAANNAYP